MEIKPIKTEKDYDNALERIERILHISASVLVNNYQLAD